MRARATIWRRRPRPAFSKTPKGNVALVAMASGKIRDGGAAAPSRPGVNEVRQDSPGVMNEEDVTRLLASIGQAARQAEIVLAYNHNHYWEPNIADTPGWQKALARRCIDAGATMIFRQIDFPDHAGFELYRGRPIFYDLGNFLYQSPDANEPYGPETWRSVIADCTLTRDGLKSATLTPIALNPVGVGGASDLETKGRPQIATGAEADATLAHLATMSAAFGTRMENRNGVGHIH